MLFISSYLMRQWHSILLKIQVSLAPSCSLFLFCGFEGQDAALTASVKDTDGFLSTNWKQIQIGAF